MMGGICDVVGWEASGVHANDVKKNRDILFPTGMQTYSMGISLMH